MNTKVLLTVCLFWAFTFSSQVITSAFKVPGIQVQKVFGDKEGNFYVVGFPRIYYNYFPDTMNTKYFIRKYGPGSTLLWETTLETHTGLHIADAQFVNDKLFIGGSFKDSLFYPSGLAISSG